MPVSLVDLLPAAKRRETVTVLGAEIECQPLTLGQIADLFLRFSNTGGLDPEMLSGGSAEVSGATIVAKLSREAIGAIIVAGTGQTDNLAAQEAAAAEFPAEEQIVLVDAILRLSAPGGVVPLAEKLFKMLGSAEGESGRAPVTRLRQVSKS